MVGIRPRSAYLATRSWRSPSEAKNTALPCGGALGAADWTVAGAEAVGAADVAATTTPDATSTRAPDRTADRKLDRKLDRNTRISST